MSGLGRPLSGDSVLHRRNPTVKLAVFLAVSLVLLLPVDPWTPAVLLVLAVPAVVLAGRIPARRLLRRAAPFAPFALSLLVVNAVTRGGPPVAVVAGLEVTAAGLRVGAALALRTVLVGVLAVAFTLTTDGARLLASLHQHARLGARPTFAVLAGYRVLEGLPGHWTTIRQAQSVRDPRHRPGALPRDPASLARATFALLVGALRQGERLGDRDGDPWAGHRSADRAPAGPAGPPGPGVRARGPGHVRGLPRRRRRTWAPCAPGRPRAAGDRLAAWVRSCVRPRS